MINKNFVFLLCLVACGKDDKDGSIFTSKELYSYESEQHTQVFDPKVTSNNKLDILLVIDNSGSMFEPQQKLAKKLEPLLSYINSTDWQIAITSSDTRDGIAKVITKDNQNEFGPTIKNLDIVGIGHEAVLFKSIQALKGNYLHNNDLGIDATQTHNDEYFSCLKEIDCYPVKSINCNRNSCNSKFPQVIQQTTRQTNRCKEREHWLREDSMLAILLITDEEHQCHDGVFGCTINDFYFYLKSIREPGATALIYGLLCLKNECNPPRHNQGSKKLTEWRDEDREGLFKNVASIQDTDYTKTLKAISQSIASSIKTNFTLDHVHDNKGETSVTFITTDGNREKLAKGEYQITGNTLAVIKKPPDNIKEIEVSYSYGK